MHATLFNISSEHGPEEAAVAKQRFSMVTILTLRLLCACDLESAVAKQSSVHRYPHIKLSRKATVLSLYPFSRRPRT
jgi:hypothetical protein